MTRLGNSPVNAPRYRKPSVRGRAPGRLPVTRGFSLLEMLAVLVLIAVATTAIAVSLVNGLRGTKVMAASRDMAAAMRYTRGQAIIQRQELALEVDVGEKSYTAPGRATVKLPEDMTLTLRTAGSELTHENAGRIRFFPDGSSTGGFVRLATERREWLVNVAWLTGEISLEEVHE